MNLDQILTVLNRYECRYLLIGGMNFLLRHQPVLTYDVDLWIEDSVENRRKCEAALANLDAQWGPTDEDWGPASQRASGWLDMQAVYCLTTPHGAVDIFRNVAGLDDWQVCWNRAPAEVTAAGTPYRGLADEDMLCCQLALAEGSQKQERIRALRDAIQHRGGTT